MASLTGEGSLTIGEVTVDVISLQGVELFPVITYSVTKDQAITYNSETLVLSADISYHNEITSADVSINSVGVFTGNYNQVTATQFIIEIECERTGQLSLTVIGRL